MAHFQEPKLAYSRDPVLLWVALISVFSILVVILGLTLGHAIAERRSAMLSFVNSYQVAETGIAHRPVRVILAQ
jgi:hypothetical protein